MVRIDDVYQKVLAIANKEQRGYITPQEFNLFADYAQMEIFDQYFYDLSRQKRVIESNDVQHTNPVDIIEDKLFYFKKESDIDDEYDLEGSTDFYRIERVYGTPLDDTTHNVVECNKVEKDYSSKRKNLLMPTVERPQYRLFNNNIIILPGSATVQTHNFHLCYIRKPLKPNWTYLINNGNALYNGTANDHQDFELHSSEENKLIIKILQLSGIAIKDLNLVQVAAQEEIKKIQQEK